MEVTLKSIWHIINAPISVLFIGTGMGWMFLNLIWKPFKERQKTKKQTENYRQEVYFRLTALDNYFDKKQFGTGIINLIDGRTSINPALKDFNLSSLVKYGWDEKTYKNTFDKISSVKDFAYEENRINDEDAAIKKALDLIKGIEIYLKNKE